ncbi:MAG: hypothetical protein Kow00129_08100 [Thermoleophilia bacterium]
MQSALSIARNSALVFGTHGVALVAGLLSSILTARFLGPEGRGALIVVNITTNLLALLAGLGLSYSLTYFIGKDRISPQQALGFATLAAFFLGGMALVAGLAAFILLEDSVFEGIALGAMLAGLASLPAAMFTELWQSTRMARGDFTSAAALQNLSTLVLFGVTAVILVPLAGSVAYLLIGLSVALWVVAGLGWMWSFRQEGISLRLPRALLREVFGYGGTVYLGSLVNSVYLRVDSYILNALGGTAQVGQYSVALTLNERLWVAESSIAQAALPVVIRSGREEAARLTALTARTSLVITAVPAGFLGLAAPWLIPFLYGAAFEPAVLPLQLLLAGTVAYPPGRAFANYFSGQLGRPRITTLVAFGTAAVSVVLFLLLIPPFGASGAAAASSIVYAGVTVVLLWLFTRHTKLPLRGVVLPTMDDASVYRNVATRLTGRLRILVSRGGS